MQGLVVAIAIATVMLSVAFCTGCTTVDQKPTPQVKPETFTTAQTPVPIKCIKDEDVPTYPNLTTFDTEKSSPKQVTAANAADLQAFKLYADAARDQLAKCTKGISP